MEDRTLVCQDCGEEFVFTVGEQEFYQEKVLTMNQKDVVNVEQKENKLEDQETATSRNF